MNYIVFLLLSLIFLGFLITKYRKVSFKFFLLLLMSLIISFPSESLNSAKEGINLWLFVVIPSLLPFFIINDMLVMLGMPYNISILFAPLVKFLFNTSGYGAYVFIMSIFSGYPAGAKITSQLIENNRITKDEGEKILTFCSTSGPLFIIGAVGAGMLNSIEAGYILYISHIIGALLNGILFRFIKRDKSNIKKEVSIKSPIKYGIGEMLSKSISNSLLTSGYIGGYIILFSVIISMLREINFFDTLSSIMNLFKIPNVISELISILLKTSIEISNGCRILSESNITLYSKMVIISFIIGFSGFSIIGQAATILNKTRVRIGFYILSKLFHGILSSIACIIILKYNIFSNMATTSTLRPILLNPILLIIIVLILIFFINIISKLCFKNR